MKLLSFLVLTSAVLLSGCAQPQDGQRLAGTPTGSIYTPLGSLIAKKSAARDETQKLDVQTFNDARTMTSGVNNSSK